MFQKGQRMVVSPFSVFFNCLPEILFGAGMLPLKQRQWRQDGRLLIRFYGWHTYGPRTESKICSFEVNPLLMMEAVMYKPTWRLGISWDWPEPSDGCIHERDLQFPAPILRKTCCLKESETPCVMGSWGEAKLLGTSGLPIFKAGVLLSSACVPGLCPSLWGNETLPGLS